jgi:hypothetical protein
MHWAVLLFRVLVTVDGLIFNPIYENFLRKKETDDKYKVNFDLIFLKQ